MKETKKVMTPTGQVKTTATATANQPAAAPAAKPEPKVEAPPVILYEDADIKILKESVGGDDEAVQIAIKEFKTLAAAIAFLGESKTLSMLNQRFASLIRSKVKTTILPDGKEPNRAAKIKELVSKAEGGLVFGVQEAKDYKPGQREGGSFDERLAKLIKIAMDKSTAYTPEQKQAALVEAQGMILEKQNKALERASKKAA